MTLLDKPALIGPALVGPLAGWPLEPLPDFH